jgi:hypothetical protein
METTLQRYERLVRHGAARFDPSQLPLRPYAVGPFSRYLNSKTVYYTFSVAKAARHWLTPTSTSRSLGCL